MRAKHELAFRIVTVICAVSAITFAALLEMHRLLF
jgi:hypothetical protein